jgi:hypothetical protein
MARSVVPPHLRNAAGVADGPYCEVHTPSLVQRQEFLSRIARGASMHAAASEVGLPFLAFGRLLVADETFASDLEAARVLRNMALEEIAIEQSTVGIDEVLTHQGRVSYEYEGDYELDESGEWRPMPGSRRVPVTVKKLVTSNPSLLAILRANYPDKYRERSEVITRDGDKGPARITNQDDRTKLIALLKARASQRKQLPDPNEDLL